jgi:hypothetical protein
MKTSLGSGMYFLTLRRGDGRPVTYKIVKL